MPATTKSVVSPVKFGSSDACPSQNKLFKSKLPVPLTKTAEEELL
jgi:hypothetical protein